MTKHLNDLEELKDIIDELEPSNVNDINQQDIEDFKTKLEKEYGAVNISLEDGTCTPIEEKSE